MADILVSIISLGQTLYEGLIGNPLLTKLKKLILNLNIQLTIFC